MRKGPYYTEDILVEKMQIQKENGFRIFITVPKNEGKR